MSNISAESFMNTISVNVNNEKLSDADFRQFIRNTLPIVDFSHYTNKVDFSITGTYGNGPKDEDDVYTVEEFINCCKRNAFVDGDGFGYPVKDSKSNPRIVIQPSKLDSIPVDATHIVWFNK